MKSDGLENKESTSIEDQPMPSDDEPLVEVTSRAKCPKIFLTVEPMIGAVFLSDALSGAVITNLIVSRTCETHFHFNKSLCINLEGGSKNESEIEALVQPYAAVILTSMSFLSIFLPAIMSLFVGPWSDKNGRKLLLVVPVFGYCLKYILLGVFSCFPNLQSEFGLVTVVPVALSGGIVNYVTAGYSYISDTSNEENRSFRISLLEAFMFCGSIIGISCTSPLFKAGGPHGYLLIFGLCAAINFLSAIVTYFCLPESVSTTEDGKGIQDIFDFKHFRDTIRVCFKKREGCRRAIIFLVIICLTLTISAMEGESNVKFLFVRLRFGWNIHDFSVWTAISLALSFLGLLLGSILLTKWLKIPDAILGLISYSMELAGSFYQAFVPSSSPNMMYYVGLVKLFGGLCGPAGRSVLSKSIAKEDLGKVFALNGSSESLFPLVIAPIYTFLYNSTIDVLPSAFLFLSALFYTICCISFATIYFIQKSFKRVEHQIMENENEAE